MDYTDFVFFGIPPPHRPPSFCFEVHAVSRSQELSVFSRWLSPEGKLSALLREGLCDNNL